MIDKRIIESAGAPTVNDIWLNRVGEDFVLKTYFADEWKLIGGDLSKCESTENKVTSITESSSDSQYPSAKAVYTYVNTVLGDIETILASI